MILPCLVPSRPIASVTLRFQPPVGTVASYIQTTAMRQTTPGIAKPIVSTTTTPMTLRIVARDAGVTTIESKTGKVTIDLPADSPAAKMKADLEKTGSDVTTTVRVDEAGDLLTSKVEAGGPNADFVRRIGAGVTKGLQGVSYPKRPLDVGDAWGDTMDLGKMFAAMMSGMGVQAQGKAALGFRLVSLTEGLARIVFTVSGRAVVQGKAATMTMDTTAVGETSVDGETGLVRTSKTTSDNVIAVQGQAMRQHIVTTLESVTIGPAAPR